MGKRGPKAWEPTPAERRMVEHYAAIGYTQEQIASLMGKSESTIKTYFKDELKNGSLKVNAQIGGKLFQKAMSGDTASLIFWAKTRMGWKERQEVEHSGRMAVSHTLDTSKLSEAALREIAGLKGGE